MAFECKGLVIKVFKSKIEFLTKLFSCLCFCIFVELVLFNRKYSKLPVFKSY